MSLSLDLTRARLAAGISRKELARKSGVSTTTVSRVEDGAMDPTFTMTQRLFGALGLDAHLNIRPTPKIAVAQLSNALISQSGGVEIDYVRIRVFVDRMVRSPSQIERAITQPPARSGDDKLDCLLAAVSEKLADDAGLERPKWCAAVPVLVEIWRAPGTPVMNARNDALAPPQFIVRNIFLSSLTFWRPEGWF
ncbi:MAG: XRE family transcriptional regulator [Actinobacteria bacterium]|nr:MAG: XRE family transcriptional regulator [Actinomycetota bacterium]